MSEASITITLKAKEWLAAEEAICVAMDNSVYRGRHARNADKAMNSIGAALQTGGRHACPRCAALESAVARLREALDREKPSRDYWKDVCTAEIRNGERLKGERDAKAAQLAELAAAVRVREAGGPDTHLWNEAGERIRDLLRRAEGEAGIPVVGYAEMERQRDAARTLLGELVDEILATAREFDGVASSAARFNHCLRLAREFKARAGTEAGGGAVK